MKDERFLDTNVLVYLYSTAEPDKQTLAQAVVLVIPDAGPLISLGRANGLDLLLRLHLPIYLIDQVYFEVTRDFAFEDAKLVKQFVELHPQQVKIVDTQAHVGWNERWQTPIYKTNRA